MKPSMKKQNLFIVCTHLTTVFLDFKKMYAEQIVKSKNESEVEKIQTDL
jgi:hypothetical protein